jgi:hypothetical protein
VTRDPDAGAPRTALGLYALAFVSLLAAAAFIGVAARDFLAHRAPLWVSIGCSALAIVTAGAGLALSRRR